MTRKKKEKNRNTWLKVSLYLISLWILFLMWIVLKIDISKSARISIVEFLKCNIVPLICIVLIFVGFTGYICFRDSLNNTKDLPIKITECESINYENLSFLATYIIPLVCFPMEECNEVIVMFAVIFVIGCIFVKTNLYYTNPSLLLVGFNVYEIEADSKKLSKGIVIVRGEISTGDSIKYFHLSDNVYYGRRIKNEGK